MKKKLLSILLAALMILPFGIMSALSVAADGAASLLPAEPKLTGDKVVYYSLNGTNPFGATSDANDGLTNATAKSSYGTSTGSGTISLLKDAGGTIAIPGKSWGGVDGFTFILYNTILRKFYFLEFDFEYYCFSRRNITAKRSFYNDER